MGVGLKWGLNLPGTVALPHLFFIENLEAAPEATLKGF